MQRRLLIDVDQSTWPAGVTMPPAFTPGQTQADIDISLMLLLLGYLTTPTTGAGVRMAEFWAWVRYYYAMSDHPDLRLTVDYADLDSHVKSVLSDDLGVGLSMYWLAETLQFTACCDGRYFMLRWPAAAGLPPNPPAKRGPFKSPDFVAMDPGGLLNVVECKGTQSGSSARAGQMLHTLRSSLSGGGRIQKRTIVIPRPFRGQSLACGALIASERSQFESSLLVQDPEQSDQDAIPPEMEKLALDAVFRGAIAKMLRCCGMAATADVIAAPSGAGPDASPNTRRIARRAEATRLAMVADKRARAENEIGQRLLESRFETGTGAGAFVGRSVSFDLPRELTLDGQTYRRIDIRQGLPEEFIYDLKGNGLHEGDIQVLAPDLVARIGPFKGSSEGPFASMRFGSSYYADVRLS